MLTHYTNDKLGTIYRLDASECIWLGNYAYIKGSLPEAQQHIVPICHKGFVRFPATKKGLADAIAKAEKWEQIIKSNHAALEKRLVFTYETCIMLWADKIPTGTLLWVSEVVPMFEKSKKAIFAGHIGD